MADSQKEKLQEEELRNKLLGVPRLFHKRLPQAFLEEQQPQQQGSSADDRRCGIAVEVPSEQQSPEQHEQHNFRSRLLGVPRVFHKRSPRGNAEEAQPGVFGRPGEATSTVDASAAAWAATASTAAHHQEQSQRRQTQDLDQLRAKLLAVPRALHRRPTQVSTPGREAATSPSVPSTPRYRPASRQEPRPQSSHGAPKSPRSPRSVTFSTRGPASARGTRKVASPPAEQPWRKEMIWSLFDDFEEMDLLNAGCIRLQDFVWAQSALAAHNSLAVPESPHGAKLAQYFGKPASEELTVDGFICLAFPAAKIEELAQFRRWADLRKAYLLLTRHRFSAQDGELRRIFKFLSRDPGVDRLSIEDLVSSSILTQIEVKRYQPAGGYPSPFTYVQFRKAFRAVLAAKYGSHDATSPEWQKAAERKFPNRDKQKSPPMKAFCRLDVIGNAPSVTAPSSMWTVPDVIPQIREALCIEGLSVEETLNLRRARWGFPPLPFAERAGSKQCADAHGSEQLDEG
eukprot:TRINITY_DN94039_c0_g1_i1.p1 TRINITY_DN94039_c0_g1~~TRINITY_DN94039_c0_g1_i1.p1  ORF type:complete len:513 (+),score=110.98 TRINITY_DN94039_c0_g1_i1:31-1569(+)